MNSKIASVVNIIILVAIAVCYGELLQYFLPKIYVQFEEPMPDIFKMVVTFTTALLSTAVVYFCNTLIIRQNMLAVGFASSIGALWWYYVIKGYPNIMSSIIFSLMERHSLFAVLAFTLLPIVFGITLKSWFNYSGMLVFSAGKEESA